ncbi:hypothetical protein cypCar_00044436 [Cyprinus carpio]|nr:hypothetical protein cypCar_00044436 [Cyprinus carpio]
MRTLHRLKLMSSPSLSDLGRSERSALDDRNNQQHRAGANATWNSIHNAVIAVFQHKDLGENELYVLNEGVSGCELSLIVIVSQNQLLTKGMVILRDKIHFYEDSVCVCVCVQGKEPSVRQLALLHFRNIITLNIKLDDALTRPRARVPPSIIQMLLILQGVHESKGVSGDYLKLESLVQKVVSPYLGTRGLISGDGSVAQSSEVPLLTDVCEDPSPPVFCELGSSAAERDSSASSPETIVDQILESLDSDTEGIFIDFRRQRSSSSDFSRESESAA